MVSNERPRPKSQSERGKNDQPSSFVPIFVFLFLVAFSRPLVWWETSFRHASRQRPASSPHHRWRAIERIQVNDYTSPCSLTPSPSFRIDSDALAISNSVSVACVCLFVFLFSIRFRYSGHGAQGRALSAGKGENDVSAQMN